MTLNKSEESEVVIHSDDPVVRVGYLKLNKLKLESKSSTVDLKERLSCVPLKNSDGYITDYGEDVEDYFNNVSIDDSGATNDKQEHINVNMQFQQSVMCGKNQSGWLWIGGLTGNDEDIGQALLQALEKLKSNLEVNNHTFKDICSVCLYISDMSKFAQLNDVYLKMLNHINPPTRACVEIPLPKDNPVLLDVISWTPSVTSDDLEIDRRTLHIQSISHWAPANIGPYSQVVKIGNFIYLAGIIGLVPGSLELVKGGLKYQCQLALRHIDRILAKIESNVNLRDVVQAICYLTDAKYVESARKLWESKTNNAIVNYVIVSGLPKNAFVEWHVWAHKYNSTFGYEETGICIKEWTISVYRRSSYESDIASIVCNVDNFIQYEVSLPIDVCKGAIEFVIDKLQGEDAPTRFVCNLKVFYITSKTIPTAAIIEVLDSLSQMLPVVYTLIPVVGLHNLNSYMSISGIQM